MSILNTLRGPVAPGAEAGGVAVVLQKGVAQRVLGDDEQPRPIRFLTSISVKVQSFYAPKCRQGQVVGFKVE